MAAADQEQPATTQAPRTKRASRAPAKPRAAAKTRSPAKPGGAAAQAPAPRSRNGRDTRDNILRAAVQIFARHGLAGGRIEQISRLARSNDRMIYYYFKSKENLFIEALRDTYRKMNEAESALQLDLADPVAALTAITHFVWNYYLKNPLLITLLNTENLHRGRHIRKDPDVHTLSMPALALLSDVLAEGRRQKKFRTDLQPRQLYITIASLGYFYLSNAYTLSAFLDADLLAREEKDQWLRWITEVVLRAVLR